MKTEKKDGAWEGRGERREKWKKEDKWGKKRKKRKTTYGVKREKGQTDRRGE